MWMIQKATATGSWWLAASSWQYTHSCILSPAEIFGKPLKQPGDSASLQPRFGTLRLLAFPKTKITFEREEISDRQWDSGKYSIAADGIGRTVCGPNVPTLKGSEVSLSYVQCFLYLVSFSVNVPIFAHCMAKYLLDRPRIHLYLHIYMYTCIYTYTHIYTCI